MPPDPDYTLAELASLSDVSPRTIRYYIAQGLLPSPEAAGPSTRYPAAVLARLRLIKQLQRQHLPLAEIRRQLAELSDGEIAELSAMAPEAPVDSALDYIRSLLAPERPEPSHPLLRRASQGIGRGTGSPRPGLLPPPRFTMGEGSERPAGRVGPPSPKRVDELSFDEPAASGPSLDLPPAAPVAVPTTPGPASRRSVGPTVPIVSPTPPAAAAGPERSQWERITLEPDVELHVRRPLSRIANKRVDRLVAFARQLLEEDQP